MCGTLRHSQRAGFGADRGTRIFFFTSPAAHLMNFGNTRCARARLSTLWCNLQHGIIGGCALLLLLPDGCTVHVGARCDCCL